MSMQSDLQHNVENVCSQDTCSLCIVNSMHALINGGAVQALSQNIAMMSSVTTKS